VGLELHRRGGLLLFAFIVFPPPSNAGGEAAGNLVNEPCFTVTKCAAYAPGGFDDDDCVVDVVAIVPRLSSTNSKNTGVALL